MSKDTAERRLDEQVDRWASHALKLGIWVSAGLMVLGLLMGYAGILPLILTGGNPRLEELAREFFSRSLNATTLMYGGLVILMVTPVLRVLTAIVGFGAEKDWKFVCVSCVVFALLAGEIIFSLSG